MTLLPKVKLKTVVSFPANVYGGAGIDVTKANGALTVDLDYSDFGVVSAIPTSPTSNILTYDTQTNAYIMVPSHLLGGGVSGIADAPIDGYQYGRQSGYWTQIAVGGADVASVKTYGASGSSLTTTGTIAAGSAALNLTSAGDFQTGHGVLIFGAGAAAAASAPATISLGLINASPTATVMTYAIASLDQNGGISASISTNLNSVPLSSLGSYVAAGIVMNQLTWSVGSGALATVVWRKIDSGAYQLLGCFQGGGIFDCGLPQVSMAGVPATPAPLNQWFISAVAAGAGTNNLTLQANALSSVSGALVQHDDTATINAAMAANSAVRFPPGNYNVTGLQIPSSVCSVVGSYGASVINSFTQTSLGAGVSAAAASNLFSMSGMTILAAKSMAYDGFTLSGSTKPILSGNFFRGLNALRLTSCANAIISTNQILGWWNIGIFNDANSETMIQNNLIGPISGQVGALAITPTPSGSAYLYATGIHSGGGFGCTISSNAIFLFGGNWGISGQDPGVVIANNVVKYSGREAIVAGGTTGSYFKVTGNYCFWQPAGNGNLSCYDFGMSMADDGVHGISDGDVSDNTFINSGLSSIAVFGSGAVGAPYNNVTIGGNSIFGACQRAAIAGIELSGSNVTGIVVDTNSFLAPAQMTFAVQEVNTNGIPNNNTINTQLGAGSSGLVSLLGAASAYLDGFAFYAPVVVCTQSTGAVVTTAGARYQVQGKKVLLTLIVSISGTFTGGTLTSMSLPFPALSQSVNWLFQGREALMTGAEWVGTVRPGATTLIATSYNNSAVITTGEQISFTGWYERA